jgi:hypothetical protein
MGKVTQPAATDPITQLLLGILARDTPEARAGEGLERLRGMVVDYNELRVVPPIELAEVLGDFPNARLKCEDISRALNAVFAEEHTVSLDRLAGLPKKEVQAVLDQIDGLEPYTRARIRLLGLHLHAIPLDEAMWALARREHLVDPRCPLQEAQQFLERQIAEEDGREFVALLKRHAWSEMGTAVKKREVQRIQSVPPDRTSRNMLQLVGRLSAPELELSATEEPATASMENASQADEGPVDLPGSRAAPRGRGARSKGRSPPAKGAPQPARRARKRTRAKARTGAKQRRVRPTAPQSATLAAKARGSSKKPSRRARSA